MSSWFGGSSKPPPPPPASSSYESDPFDYAPPPPPASSSFGGGGAMSQDSLEQALMMEQVRPRDAAPHGRLTWTPPLLATCCGSYRGFSSAKKKARLTHQCARPREN